MPTLPFLRSSHFKLCPMISVLTHSRESLPKIILNQILDSISSSKDYSGIILQLFSGQNPVSRSTLLNINISVSLALCLFRQFESKFQVKFDFNWIWTYFNSNCHFFAFVVTDIIQFSWFANNWIPLCSHQCLTYCNIHNLHACIICRFAYHAMHRICRYCNLHTNCNQLDIVCSRSHLKYWHHIVRVFFHQCVANIQNAVFLQ